MGILVGLFCIKLAHACRADRNQVVTQSPLLIEIAIEEGVSKIKRFQLSKISGLNFICFYS